MLTLIAAMNAFASNGLEALELKAKIGFVGGEDRIVKYELLNNERIVLIGEKNIQVWDTRDFKPISSVPHQIPQFSPHGFFSNYILLGLPKILDLWKPYIVDPKGRFIITAEKIGNNKLQSAVVRDLKTLKQTAVLDLPNVSTEFVTLDENNSVIRTFGETDNTGAFAVWDPETFQIKSMVSVDDYMWHHLIRNDGKAITGSGDTKFSWNDLNVKQGDKLTLRDVTTGNIEKEFIAENLVSRTTFRQTKISKDEKFLISIRDDRIVVWDIDGDGWPRFEVSAKGEKKDYVLVKVIDGRFLAVSVNKNFRVYDIAGNGEPQFAIASANPNDTVRLYDQTKDGRYIAVADDSKVSVLETKGNGKPVYEFNRENDNERFTLIKFFEERNSLAIGRVNRSEKKPERTEFYDIETGRLSVEVPIGFTSNVTLSPDQSFLYDHGFAGTAVWNFAQSTSFFISLETHEPRFKPGAVTQETPYKIEYTSLGPDGSLLLKYGGDVVSVYDVETGIEIQKLFDAKRVKYNKKNEVKKSGLGNAFWALVNTGVFALDDKFNTVNFWKIS